MNILPIKTENKNTTFAFRGVEHFNYVKKLDGMVCAVCGRKALVTDTFVKKNIPNCKPLIYNMQKQALSYIEENFPSAWALLVSFTEKFPNQSLDEIMEDSKNYIELKQAVTNQIQQKKADKEKTDDVVCIDRTIGSTFFDMLEAGRSYLEPASVVLKNLAEFKDFLTEEQLEAYEILEKHSQKYPDKTLSEIINIEEIYTHHDLQARIKHRKLCDKMHFHLNNIGAIVEEENPETVPLFYALKNSAIKDFKEIADPQARIHRLKNMYRKVLIQNNCEHLLEKVYKEIDQIPMIYMSADAYLSFAHKHNYSDGKIIAQLFYPNYATEEHLDAVAEGGIDKAENKLVMHKSCNQLRNRIPYTIFTQYHPKMQEYIQHQVDLVSDALLKEEIPSFLDFYPLKMPLKLAEITENAIKIDITRYCIEGIKLSLKKEERLNEELYDVLNSRDRKIVEKMKDKRPNPQLDAELKFLHSEIFRIKESIKIEGKKRFRMQEYLKSQGVQE